MKTLIIKTDTDKGRSFQTNLLSWIDAPSLIDCANSQNNRPIWMAYAGSEQANKLFSLNLLRGKIAEIESDRYNRSPERFQLLKTMGYQSHIKKYGKGVVTTVYIPELFYIDPGMVDPNCIKFILMRSRSWMNRQEFDVSSILNFLESSGLTLFNFKTKESTRPFKEDDIQNLATLAVLFHSYLDRRIRYPMPMNVCFAIQLLLRCLLCGFAQPHNDHYSWSEKRNNFAYHEWHLDNLGLTPGLGFHATHEDFAKVLSEEITSWHFNERLQTIKKREGLI